MSLTFKFLLLTLVLGFSACTPTTSSRKDPSSYYNNPYYYPTYYYYTPVPTATTYDPYPYPTFTATSTSSCSNVTGTNRPSGGNWTPWCRVVAKKGTYAWNTYSDYSSSYHSAFATDVAFKVKVTVNSVPSSCLPSGGSYSLKSYNKLRFDIGIGIDGTNFFYPVSGALQSVGESKVYDLSPYVNSSTSCPYPQYINGAPACPQYITITNVRSDHACAIYACSTSGDEWCQYVCPSEWQIPSKSCWGMEVQISTDNHKDIN